MENILIVDDDFLVLDQLKNILASEARNVSFVAKAEFALMRIEKEQFDLLLLDVNMPGINGIELLKKIREIETYNDVPVIMITGDNDTSTFINCFENGANDYIEKPINNTILNARVNAALAFRKQLVENQNKTKKINKIQLQLERQKTVQQELRGLVSRMNPHFVFNILNAIQYHVLENDKDLALEGISGFSKLVRTSLNHSEKDLIFLDEEIDFLTNYLELEQTRLGKKLSFKVNITDELLNDEIMIPPMIIQPFVENAIVHGISNLENDGLLDLSFSLEDEYLFVKITDNGIGRKKAETLKKQRKGNTHQSKAQSIIDLRMQMFEEFHGKNFNYKIIDLENDNIPSGTLIELYIPNDLEV